MEAVAHIRTLEEICDESREYAEHMDSGRWKIGDNALEVQKSYGEDTLGTYANNINVPVGRIQEYRTVCGFYDYPRRQTFIEESPSICYSHMRLAMRLEDEDRAYWFLERCAVRTWTVGRAQYVMARLLAIYGGKPRKRARQLAEFTAAHSAAPDTLAQALASYEATKTVRVVVYEVL